MRRAIIHIGIEKTGSSTIQNSLARNRKALAEQKIIYSRAAGEANHGKLAAYSADSHKRAHLKTRLGIVDAQTLAAFRTGLESDLRTECAKSPADCTMIFSTEYGHSLLTSEPEVARLKALLAPLFDQFTIIVYLRRQDELAVSRYSTFILDGGTRRNLLPDVGPDSPYFNFETLLERWSNVFGADRIVPRLFLREEMQDGNVVMDFFSQCNIRVTDTIKLPEWRNQSLQASAHEFLRQFNELLPRSSGDAFNIERGSLTAVIRNEFSGQGLRPRQCEAKRFLDIFRDSNERVRKKWFRERQLLFPDDFSAYPEEADVGANFDDAVKIAVALWREHLEETNKLRREIGELESHMAAQERDSNVMRPTKWLQRLLGRFLTD